MFAFVRFLEDNVCYALPAARVRGFHPRSHTDFDNRNVYSVYRQPEGEPGEPAQPAQILALAGGGDRVRGVTVVRGGILSDSVSGGILSDSVSGGILSDSVSGGILSDSVRGGILSDSVRGGILSDSVRGGILSDSVRGGILSDSVRGGILSDSVRGGILSDSVRGGILSDSCERGGILSDSVRGGILSDSVRGGILTRRWMSSCYVSPAGEGACADPEPTPRPSALQLGMGGGRERGAAILIPHIKGSIESIIQWNSSRGYRRWPAHNNLKYRSTVLNRGSNLMKRRSSVGYIKENNMENSPMEDPMFHVTWRYACYFSLLVRSSFHKIATPGRYCYLCYRSIVLRSICQRWIALRSICQPVGSLCAPLLSPGARRIFRCQGSRVLAVGGSRARGGFGGWESPGEAGWRTMFAFVRFLEDNVCYALPAARVRGFHPRSHTDFDNRNVYSVYRQPEGEPGEPAQPAQPAQILALAENKSDLETSVMQKKIKIPKLCLNSSNDSWEFRAYEVEEDSEHRHIKKPEGRKQVEGTHKSIEAVVAKLEKQNGLGQSHDTSCKVSLLDSCQAIGHMNGRDEALVPRALYEELLRSYQQQQEEMRHIQHELERTRRQLIQQAKKLKDYGTLVTEVKELRVLNRRLQDVLLLRLGSDPAIDLESEKPEYQDPEPDIQTTTTDEANTSFFYPTPAPVQDKYILENGKVHLGSGVWINEEKWHQLQATQGDSKYTKNLAVMIWGTEVLKNRSVTGVATKKKKDAVPKPPLSPQKLSVVRECMYDRIAQETMDENEIAQRLSKVNKYICEKIMDINKSCKNEERREAKHSVQ
ncbi:BEN domain-containing 5 isoform X1 [Pelobates cultripes]|uniref:BEN domain-containing protein 5 n=1 Tax=Pelobates cultripes TaxID=61616 RepID=A0AAD1SXJ3_PELCU|nr:BEN domain-containing 5 isoform X1 [Pelobates cultripes]